MNEPHYRATRAAQKAAVLAVGHNPGQVNIDGFSLEEIGIGRGLLRFEIVLSLNPEEYARVRRTMDAAYRMTLGEDA